MQNLKKIKKSFERIPEKRLISSTKAKIEMGQLSKTFDDNKIILNTMKSSITEIVQRHI